MPGTGPDRLFSYLWQESSLVSTLSPLPVIPGDQKDQATLCKVTAVLSSSRDTHRGPTSLRFHLPHTGLLPRPDSAKPIFTTLSSRKDGIYTHCDRCRTTCFKMDSRSYRKQHRRDKGKCEKRDCQRNVCGQFLSGGSVLGNRDGAPGLPPARPTLHL